MLIMNELQMAWLTHSSPQFFTPTQWDGFKKVHKKNRAKVALALQFEAVVLAVLSLDLLVQVFVQLFQIILFIPINLLLYFLIL